MEIITYLASRVWTFFMFITNLCLSTFSDLFGSGIDVTASNPFNDFVIQRHIEIKGGLTGKILEWLADFVLPNGATLFDAVLILFLAIFATSILVRFISFLTAD